jgi:hypothetical protein
LLSTLDVSDENSSENNVVTNDSPKSSGTIQNFSDTPSNNKNKRKNVNNEIIEESEYEKYKSKKVKEEKKDDDDAPYFTPSPSPERDE